MTNKLIKLFTSDTFKITAWFILSIIFMGLVENPLYY